MKKATSKAVQEEMDTIRAEYDFTGGVRGKHYHAMQAGYTIKIHKADGTTEIQEVKPRGGAIILDPDVRAYFPSSESVNAALRSLIQLIPDKRAKDIRIAKRPSKKRAHA